MASIRELSDEEIDKRLLEQSVNTKDTSNVVSFNPERPDITMLSDKEIDESIALSNAPQFNFKSAPAEPLKPSTSISQKPIEQSDIIPQSIKSAIPELATSTVASVLRGAKTGIRKDPKGAAIVGGAAAFGDFLRQGGGFIEKKFGKDVPVFKDTLGALVTEEDAPRDSQEFCF